MKKRFLTFILSIAAVVSCAFAFSACSPEEHKHFYTLEITKKATCTEKGEWTYTCACGDSYTQEMAALGHDEKTHEAKAPTCTEIGWEEYVTCEREGCEYTTYVEIPALDHDKVQHNAQAATCTEKGWNAYETCSRCDYTTYVEIPATGVHTWDDGKITTEPTCTEKGVKTFTCTVCKTATYTEDVEVLKHDEKTHAAKVPTCTEIGWNEYVTCEREGCEYSTYEEIPALDHDKVQHNAQAATCTEKGWNAYETCSRCEYSTYVEIPATGVHTWDKGEETKAPTCTEEGETTYTCTVCKTATKTEPIDKLPHEHNTEKWTSNATHHWHECVCGDKKDEEQHTAGAPATATTPQICTVCGYVLQAETGILFNTLTVEGTNVYGKVSNATTEFSFIDEVTVKGNAKYVVALDKNAMQTVITKTVTLQEGDNTIYVFETNGDEIVNTYVIIIRRRPMYEVTFDANGGAAVEKQVIEEDYLATEPETTRTGYTFTGWDYDFTQPITENTKITASWSANTDTKYTVNYYLQNLDDDNYTLHESVELEGETDTTATAEIKEYTHFTFNQGYYYNKLSGNINGDGGQVLSVYYTRDTYSIVVNANNAKAGTSTQVNGTYKYDKGFTLTATTNAGYTFLGWYDGETCVCESEEFTFKAEKDVTYTAMWSVKSEMSNFYFTSTATSCQITGVKDKTITEIVIPDSVTSIGESAFYNCYSLTSIKVSENNTVYQSIDGNLYSKDGKTLIQYARGKTATSFTIPDSVTSIGVDAFRNCDSLTSVVIPDSVTTIGDYAFYYCESLASVEIPDSVTSIGNEAFYYCYSLTSVVIPDSVTSIGDWVFYGCSSLTSVVIPDSVTSIGNEAFRNCYSLTSITIPDSVTTIGEYAFRGCYNLVEVVNKSAHITVTKGGSSNGYVGYYALAVYNSGDAFTSKLSNDNGYIIYTDGTEKILVGYNGTETDVVLPSYITKINQYAFYKCTSLTRVVIGDSVTSIGAGAFYNCSSLTSVEIPDSVTTIGSSAFRNCSSLTSVVIPDSVTSIGNSAFYNCSSLTSVVIGGSVTTIGNSAFSDCYKLVEVVNKSARITVTKGDSSNGYVGYYALAVYNSGDAFTSKLSNDNGYIIYTDGAEKILVGYNGTETDLVLPSYITKINQYAFYNCDSLTSVVIPDSVTSIGDRAFYYCESLTSVEIPDSVTSIGSYAFAYCTSLTSVVIPDSVTSIGNSAFYNCSSLTSIMVSESNTVYQSIDGNLYSKDGKTLIQYAIGKTATSFTIPNSVTSIGSYAFEHCTSLTSVVIPDSVTMIGDYAFYYCRRLTSIKYRGTQAEWNAISKGSDWNYNTGSYTITYNYQD